MGGVSLALILLARRAHTATKIQSQPKQAFVGAKTLDKG